MIGTVEMTGFGVRIGTNGEPKVLGSRFDDPIETGALRARDLDFFGRSQRRQVIVIQIERDSSGRKGRMLAEVLRPQQALLFACHRGKQDRAARLLRTLAKGPRQFEQHAAPGRIVVGPVVDVVSRHLGTNPQVVVVRRIQNGLILELRI